MIRENVISTELRSVGYDEKALTLEVEFQSGGIYQYFGVARDVYEGLIFAASKGRYFNANIRDAYQYQRIA